MTALPSNVAGRRQAANLHSSRLYWLITALGSLAFASNGFDLATVSFSQPGLRREWDLSPLQLGFVTASLTAGQVTGALAIGWAADRLGRRLAFTLAICCSALGVGLAGLAPSHGLVLAMLFCGGVGLGGVGPVASTLVSEFAPARLRGPAIAITQVCWTAGWLLTATGGALLAETLGWRWIFGLGTAPLLLAALAWKYTPESPRYLLAHGRQAEAEALVVDIEARYGVRLPLPTQQRAARRANIFRDLAELWSPRFRRRTLVLWLSWFVMTASFNGPIFWLPTLLAAAGGSDALAARASLLVALFMVPASLLAVWLIERAGRRRLMVVSLSIAALGAFGLAVAPDDRTVILAGGALAGGVMGAWPIVLGYSAELYPTRMRASAAGWAGASSRSGGVFSPLLLGLLLSSWGGSSAAALGFFGALLLGSALLVALQGEETRGRTLEELSG